MLKQWIYVATLTVAFGCRSFVGAAECLDVKGGGAREYGRLPSDGSEKSYCIYAHAGQKMRVTIKPLTPNLVTKGIIIFPLSHHVEGGPGGVVFNGTLQEDGRYEIRVGQRYEAKSGEFEMVIELN
jgi:hypothetical protein